MDKRVRIIGIPLDLGQAKRGVNMGPAALRYAGLADRLAGLGYAVRDSGDLAVPIRESLCDQSGCDFLPAIREVNQAAYEAGREAIEDGDIPVFLGGDHSLAIGTIGGITHREPAGVIWIDAHGDFNTPQTTPSGNIHGMPLATLVGDGYPELVDVGRIGTKIDPRDVVLIGIRDLDNRERNRLNSSGIKVYTMRDIDERGISEIVHKALVRLEHRKRIHVSLDVDSLDPMVAPGVGTAIPGGLTYREAQLIMEIIADTGRLSSLDMVEINPILDERNKTAQVTVELAASLFGKSIL